MLHESNLWLFLENSTVSILFPVGSRWAGLCRYWNYPRLQAVSIYWVPAECEAPHWKPGRGDPREKKAEQHLQNLKEGCLLWGRGCKTSSFSWLPEPFSPATPALPGTCHLAALPAPAGKANWATLASSPSPAGNPSLCPSPGSVFIINISLFRSLGFSWYTAFGRIPL